MRRPTTVRKWLQLPYFLHVHTRKWPKKPKATIIFLHGLGNSGAAWNPVIEHLPSNVRVLSVDLLGFGKSPTPPGVLYNAKIQARSVAATLIKQLPTGKVIVVGHSMGALVAVELAKRYPYLVGALVLCAPPFYRPEDTPSPAREAGLKKLYRLIHTHPEQFVKISALAKKYKITNSAFELNHVNVIPYMAALESSIINQTAFQDALSIKQPGTIIHGRLDAVVLKKNLQYIATHNPALRLQVISAAHEIRTKTYVQTVVKAVEGYVDKSLT